MHKQRTLDATFRGAILVLVAVVVSACSKDVGVDFCQNHGAFHSDHLDSIARLSIEVSDTGHLEGGLSIPKTSFGEMRESDLIALLGVAENTFALQTERPCAVSVTYSAANAVGLEVEYSASCGADNKFGKINVSLFEHLKQLEEVETSVTTPATSKRFAISRQCDSPIFRLD